MILAHTSNYTKGRTKPIDRIVLHYTAGNGDTALDNARYFAGQNRKASAHYFVDETTTLLSVPEEDTAHHAGNWQMNCRSIGVELCSGKDSRGTYYFPDKTVYRAAELVRRLMEKYKIPLAGVIRHYDVTGKNCPAPMVENETLWKNFLQLLQKTPWQQAVSRGIFTSEPQKAVTRQELVTVLHKLGLLKEG